MSRQRCNTCGGEYDDVGRDGVPYYHACAPEGLVRVTRDGTDQDVRLVDVRPTDLVWVQRPGQRLKVAVSEMQPDDVRLGDTTTQRADRRDENTARVGGEREGNRVIKRRGRGATRIGDSPPMDERQARDAV